VHNLRTIGVNTDVYRGEFRGETVAVKVVRFDDEEIAAIMKEGLLLQQLGAGHVGLARLKAIVPPSGDTVGRISFVMEYLSGSPYLSSTAISHNVNVHLGGTLAKAIVDGRCGPRNLVV
jgi:predicted Ser/Thr protein kinase